MSDPKKKILNLTFNQDQSCISCGTEKGFRIFNSFPYKDTFKRDFDAGIGQAVMLFRSNLVALVGGGVHPKYPPKKVMLWDDQQMKCIGELSFKLDIRGVRFRKEKIAVILDQRVYLYNFADLKLIDAVDTCKNPSGICSLSVKDATILACPDKSPGSIRMLNYDVNSNIEKKAHDSPISCLVLSDDGKLCASAAENDPTVKIFSSETGKLLQELRRGAEKADIRNLSFDRTGKWLVCSTDKGTIHVFSSLEAFKIANKLPLAIHPEKEPPPEEKGRRSTLKFIHGMVSHVTSENSFAQFKVPDLNTIVGFGSEDKPQIIIASKEGKYYLCEFNPEKGGEMKKKAEKSLLANPQYLINSIKSILLI